MAAAGDAAGGGGPDHPREGRDARRRLAALVPQRLL
eukprot:gene594-879_t